MNPNTHNDMFPPPPPEKGVPPASQPQQQQPYYGPPQMPAPVNQPNPPQPYGPLPPQPASYKDQLPEQHYGDGREPGQGHHQQFDFIMQPEPIRQPKSISFPGSDSKIIRYTILGVGLIVLIMIIGGFMSFLNRPKFSTTALVGIAQEQAELARVASLGATSATDQSVINSAYTVKLSIASDGTQMATYLAKNHAGINEKTLELKKNPQTDARLASALTASTFDPTFTSIIQTQLQTYQRDLKSAYNSNPGPNGQKLLKAEYTNASLLETQVAQLQTGG